MATLKTVKAPAVLSLTDLQTTAQQNEQLLGPMAPDGGLGNATDMDGSKYTLLKFDMDQDPPDDRHLVTLAPCVGGSAVGQSGKTVVCTGDCYITGQIQMLAAYRSKP